jgi:hypothetical protein
MGRPEKCPEKTAVERDVLVRLDAHAGFHLMNPVHKQKG